MFKLIGIAVVVAVVVIGFPSLQRWYSGEATPQETVQEVRKSVGQKLITDDSGGSKSAPSSAGNPAAAPKVENEAERIMRGLSEKK